MDPITGILALGTGIAGIAGGAMSYDQAKQQEKLQKEAMGKYDAAMKGHIGDYSSAMDANIANHQAQSAGYLNTPSGVNAWLNPNMDYQMRQVANANNQQYAAGGKMLTGASMKDLQDRGQNMAKLSWNDAFSQMNASNNQGLGYVSGLTGMKNDLAGNMFNAQQGMAANQLNAAMGQRTAGAGDFLSGFANTAGAVGNIANAFR
jgi:hypothetical protein